MWSLGGILGEEAWVGSSQFEEPVYALGIK